MVSFLKEQHEKELNKLQKSLEQALHKSNVSFAAKRQKN
jgi:hypothetical protein